ncbi:hypothetical protein SAMN06269173_11056 [Hymenobacter mucosus]|uniref:Uncharacterized protein n=1 Tax=Hymenobacter mucosus TaxID=1411120 RepID=A0A238ZXM5_9BACT|nr:hypothetical protein SAMN06269173_11056 [Hymenobacter mucosus]
MNKNRLFSLKMRFFLCILGVTHGIHPANSVAYKRRNPEGWGASRVSRSGCSHTLTSSDKMEKERAETDFKFTLKLRIPQELVKWLLGFLVGGSAVALLEHWK